MQFIRLLEIDDEEYAKAEINILDLEYLEDEYDSNINIIDKD